MKKTFPTHLAHYLVGRLLSGMILPLVLITGYVYGQRPTAKQARIDAFRTKTSSVGFTNDANTEGKSSFARRSQDVLSQPALNRLFAQKLAYYTSGSSAVTLFDNYVILDPANDRLTLGYNKAYFTDLGAVKAVTSISLQSNVAKGLSPLFQGGKWQDEIGLKVRHSFGMHRGRIWYSTAQRERQQELVEQEVRLADADTTVKMGAYVQLLDIAFQNDENTKKQKLGAYRRTVAKAYVDRVTAFEVSAIDTSYNALLTYWFSVYGYLPFTKSTATISGESHEFKPYEVGGQINGLLEIGGFNVFGNLSVSYLPNDNNKTMYDSFSDLADSKDTNDIKQVSRAFGLALGKGVYTGTLQTFDTWHIKPQLVLSSQKLANALAESKAIRNVSLNLFGDLQRGKYQASTAGIGALFSLFVNDEKPLNAELYVSFRDVDNKLLPDVPVNRKTTVGFRLTLPFNSIIY
ncbi:MAG: hypothetical protein EOO39_02710 [Cytophagaceae bacterium]|nr:MAG: hypothetical protein EOO39_02710 [Cytophagaceae bacterium]